MTYGASVMGGSCSLLCDQRRAAARAAAPAAGTCGQSLNLALVIADGSDTGRADPAYDAHMLPVGEWSLAVWEKWLPISTL